MSKLIKPGQVWKSKHRIVCTLEKVCNPAYDIHNEEYWNVLILDSSYEWEKHRSIKEILIFPSVHEKL